MSVYIHSSLLIKGNAAVKDGSRLNFTAHELQSPQELYRAAGLSYMKFFKMDLLCKWAWIGAELLLNNEGLAKYEGIDRNKIAVVLQTEHGCIDVDKKFLETTREIPSPALFVYTLPNIMLGEICIRHGFKGEQLCQVSKQPDITELHFWVHDLLTHRGMEACICGWVDVYEEQKDIRLLWVTKQAGPLPFSTHTIQQLFSGI